MLKCNSPPLAVLLYLSAGSNLCMFIRQIPKCLNVPCRLVLQIPQIPILPLQFPSQPLNLGIAFHTRFDLSITRSLEFRDLFLIRENFSNKTIRTVQNSANVSFFRFWFFGSGEYRERKRVKPQRYIFL